MRDTPAEKWEQYLQPPRWKGSIRVGSGIKGARIHFRSGRHRLGCQATLERYTLPTGSAKMKKLALAMLLSIMLTAAAQDKKPPTTLRGVLLEQLRTTHNE